MVSPTQWTWVWVNSGAGDGQGGLACCCPWGHKDLDMTERLNWTDVYNWVTRLYSRDWHNVVYQLYFNKKPWKVNRQFPQLRQGTCSGRSLRVCVFWGWRFRSCCSRRTYLTWLKVSTWAQVTLLPLNYFLIAQVTHEYLFLYKIKTELRLKWFLPPTLTLITSML